MTLTVSPRRAAWLLGGAVAGLVMAGVAGQISKHVFGHDRLLGFVRLFDLDAEANVPTWYASVTLLLCAGLLGLIARAESERGGRDATRWAVLALIFVGLSIDEAASIHELAIKPLQTAWNTRGIFYFGWIIPGGIFALLVGVAYGRFLWRLPIRTRRRFVLAGALYVGGALGVEMAGGAVAGSYGREQLGYVALATVEETLEMIGILVFLYALAAHLAEVADVLHVRFAGR
ncbi:MAG TPA: hypothetical protein VFN71_12010 [Methylomirabilota bacterium]|nr:hypothetical protein [Methylomirabilota bacterium]